MVLDEQPTGFKNGGFLKTSQLHKCGFAYIWYPLCQLSVLYSTKVACTDRNNEKSGSLNIINIIFKDNSKTAQVLVIQNMNKQVTTLLPKPLMML